MENWEIQTPQQFEYQSYTQFVCRKLQHTNLSVHASFYFAHFLVMPHINLGLSSNNRSCKISHKYCKNGNGQRFNYTDQTGCSGQYI